MTIFAELLLSIAPKTEACAHKVSGRIASATVAMPGYASVNVILHVVKCFLRIVSSGQAAGGQCR